MSVVSEPRVIVRDVGVSAAVHIVDGHPTLLLSPNQSFDAAVAAVHKTLPNMHPDSARRLVRKHLPHAIQLDDLHSEPPPARRAARRRTDTLGHRSVQALIGLAVSGLLLGAFLLGMGVHQPIPRNSPAALLGALEEPVWDNPLFHFFETQGGGGYCTPIDGLRARCVDPEGGVWLAEASIRPGSVTYAFSEGRERLVIMAFASERRATRWVNEPGTQDTYRNVEVCHRYAVYGSSPERVQRIKGLLKKKAELGV